MARWVGDTFTITASVTDAAGNPADAASVTVTIRQPDGTGVGPFAMTHGTTGQYTYPFLAVQGGMHTASFVATGAIAPVGVVDFYAYPIASGLVSLEETRAELRITAADLGKYRDRLLSWIQASRLLIEDLAGDMVIAQHDEWYDGGYPTIMLMETPIASITSVTETFGANIVRALTLQVIDGVSPVNAFGYTADYDTGQLMRRVTGLAAPFAMGRRNIHVVYSSGTPGVWRENVRLANLECLRTWWIASQQGSNPQPLSGGFADESAQAQQFELPPRVIHMLGRRTRAAGIA